MTVTVTAGVGGAAVGDAVFTSATGFDHMALVAALRSRADGRDFWLYHTTAGRVANFAAFALNTTAAYLTFDVMAALAPAATDNGYRLVFGDLTRSVDRFNAPSGSSAAGAEYSVPALALPSPGYDVTDTIEYGVRRFSTLVERTALLNEYGRQRIRLQWRACSGETAHEIRAVVAAARGAGKIAFLGFDYVLVPGSFAWEQLSALHFNVSLELESVQL